MSLLPLDAFLQAMTDTGLAMHKPALVGDGTLHRYRVDGDKAGTTNGWYALHLDDQPFGAFGSWKTGQSCTWSAGKLESMTETERRVLAARMAAAKLARDTEQAAVHMSAQKRAVDLWEKAKPADNGHAYLVSKGVSSYGIKLLREQLVVPMRAADGTLHSLQFIGKDGRKTFLTGGRKRGCYHAIGRPEGVICICEGYATGATIYQVAGHATAVAFDAGNLLPVAKALRSKFPGLMMVICADNDTETEGNPGLTSAMKAARAVGAALALPQFDGVCHV